MALATLPSCCKKNKLGDDTSPSGGNTTPQTKAGVCPDAPVIIKLDKEVVLGDMGTLRVFSSDGTQVDSIRLEDAKNYDLLESGIYVPKNQIGKDVAHMDTFMDAIPCGGRWRIVPYTPLRIDGKTLSVKLHSGVLDFGKEYYLTMDKDFISGHNGFSKEDNLTIKTVSKPSSGSVLKVSGDGSKDFCTVQGAISYARKIGQNDKITIEVGEGTYEELLFIRDKNNLTIKGEGAGKTVLRYINSEAYCYGTGASSDKLPVNGEVFTAFGGRPIAYIEGCDKLLIRDLTIENTNGVMSKNGQAETIYFNNDSGHMAILNCELLSWQDTFLGKGYVYVGKSLIAGHCDYIWGYPKTCLFEDCEIRSRRCDKGYIVQARVKNESSLGFIFLNCRLTGESDANDNSIYLARSGGNSAEYDNVSYINCTMDKVISTQGWFNNPRPNPSMPTAMSGWKEYGSTDSSGNSLYMHNSYGAYLTEETAARYMLTAEDVLGYAVK